ncbi:MAG TPA: pitrilysin family protein [Nitriliruptorales bacterium]
MDFRDTTLPTGVRVVTEAMPDVRSVTIGFWFAIGSRDESSAQSGCSHFLEHLLFKGTQKRTAKQIAEELDAVGGELNAFTSREYTCFYARVLDRDLPIAVDVLGDMLVNATNTPEDVDAERQVVLEEINIHLDSPDDLVHSEFATALMGDHPLALETLGSFDSISGMARDTIHGYYLEHYRPQNLVVAAAGNLDHEAVVTLVDAMIGDLGRSQGRRPDRWPIEAWGPGNVRVRNRPTEQAHVVLGGPGLDQRSEDRWALRVLNTLLGGGMSSRLFQEIREQRGLAYSTYSYAASYTDAGTYGAYLGTTPTRVDEALKVVRDELDRLPETIDPEEVARAKGNVRGSTVLGLEDTGSRMTRLGKMVATEAELVGVDEALRRIDEVTVADVRRVAGQILGQHPRTLAVVGPFDPDEDTDRFTEFVKP